MPPLDILTLILHAASVLGLAISIVYARTKGADDYFDRAFSMVYTSIAVFVIICILFDMYKIMLAGAM